MKDIHTQLAIIRAFEAMKRAIVAGQIDHSFKFQPHVDAIQKQVEIFSKSEGAEKDYNETLLGREIRKSDKAIGNDLLLEVFKRMKKRPACKV